MEESRKKLINDLIKKSDENFELYEFLKKNEQYHGWQIVAIFYSLLCHAKAYLYSKENIKQNSISSHTDIKFWLSTERTAKLLMVYPAYNSIYMASRDARYNCKNFTNYHIERSLKNYYKVKELLKINIDGHVKESCKAEQF